MKPRKGFVLLMWTGLCEDESGLPRFFDRVGRALRALDRYPAWGRHAVSVRACERRRGADGRPVYVIGDAAPRHRS